MKVKYFKLNVSDLFNLARYGIKRDLNEPANIENILSLEDLYKVRYPELMQRIADLQYIKSKTTEFYNALEEEKAFYNVPNYFIVRERFSNGYLEYVEMFTGIPILILSEIYGKLDNKSMKLKREITQIEGIRLFSDDYIGKICDLFNIQLVKDDIDDMKEQTARQLAQRYKK
mgnify:CR=1 FL=1